jgi:hypothetical protein
MQLTDLGRATEQKVAESGALTMAAHGWTITTDQTSEQVVRSYRFEADPPAASSPHAATAGPPAALPAPASTPPTPAT